MNHQELNEETPVERVRELFNQPIGPWPARFEGMPNVCEAFRQEFDHASRHVPEPPEFPHETGIVICGGGWRFFPSLYVTIRMIRHLKCDLPIQVWYLGDLGEFDPRMAEALKDYDVGWINANAFARDTPVPCRNLQYWSIKPFAAAYAPFKTVISLDADCYPARNPTEFLTHPEFNRVRAAFWPDFDKLQPGQWERFGMAPHDEPAWESGQFIVDKTCHWNPLWLTHWMNQRNDYVYKHVYGDKDTFHLCWRKAGYEVCVPRAAGWRHVAFLHHDFAGNVLFIHRTRDKFRWNAAIDGVDVSQFYMTRQTFNAPQVVRGLPLENMAHQFFNESKERFGIGAKACPA